MQNLESHNDERMNTANAAAYLQFKKSTLDVWRCHGKGPSYMKIGYRVYYRKSDLDTWLANCLVRPHDGR